MARTQMEAMAARRGQDLANKILAASNETRLWGKLLESKDENIVLKALTYLSNRAYGMPAQAHVVEAPEGHKFGFDIPAKPDNSSEAIQ